jgi:ribokinase
VSGRLLCVGDLNADITITTVGEIVVGSDTDGRVELSGGGSAANVSAWAVRAGLDARFAGVVGDDHLGDFLLDDLASAGVDVRPIRRATTTSRSIAAIVTGGGPDDGDRSMVSDLATATVMTVDDVDTTWFDDVTWMHVTAYTYFPPAGRAVFARLVEIAGERRIPWSLDPSSSQMLASETTRAEAFAAFAGASILFPNRDESEWLSDISDPIAAAAMLLDLAETVAVTCGDRGAFVARRGRPTFQVDPEPGQMVNALGCGDAFAAGFIAGRLGGLDDRAAAHLAAATAARALALPTSR